MAYRTAPADPRIEALRQLIAGEPALLDERSRLRHEQDDLETAAEPPRPGLFKRMFGGDRAATDASAATTKLEASVVAERAIIDKLAAIEAARTELAALEAEQLTALREAEGPIGDELRALAATHAETTTRIDALQGALVVAERAAVSLRAVGDHVRDLGPAKLSQRSLAGMMFNDTSDADIVRGRIRDALAYAREQLRALADTCDGVRAVWPAIDDHIKAAALRAACVAADTDPVEDSDLARGGFAIASRIDAAISALLEERRRHDARRAELVAQERAVIARA